MSHNLCLQSVGPDLRFGMTGTASNAQIRGTLVGLEVRTPDLSALDTIQVASPLLDTDAANKAYVDAVANGLSWKAPVRLCTTAALPANTQTGAGATLTADANGAIPNIDGVAPVLSDRILVREEGGGTSTKNGIYELTQVGTAGTPWILTRTADALAGSDAASSAMFCEEGTAGADSAFVQTEDSPVAYNTDATTFTLFSSVVSGVTSIADAAGITGISVIDSGAAPVPKLRAILGGQSLTASLVGTDVSIGVDALGIGTAQLAANAVTPAKFAPLAAVSYVQGTFAYTDTGTDVAIGTIPASSVVVSSSVLVTTAFAPNPITVDLKVNAVSRQGTTKSDLAVVGSYECDDVSTDVGAAVATVGIAAGMTQGAATATFCYLRTS
ncbi:MAG TPA: hypothetical protein VM243_09340 [Phycisphaerae bacterium]|nr:hypothetical protein [Phycisphaerae bacterium]